MRFPARMMSPPSKLPAPSFATRASRLSAAKRSKRQLDGVRLLTCSAGRVFLLGYSPNSLYSLRFMKIQILKPESQVRNDAVAPAAAARAFAPSVSVVFGVWSLVIG